MLLVPVVQHFVALDAAIIRLRPKSRINIVRPSTPYRAGPILMRNRSSLARKEDARLLRGAGLFTDDVIDEGLLHVHIVRSP
jgi:hypothetical protein